MIYWLKVLGEKWKAYYKRAFKGECFETEEEYVDSSSNIVKYNQITFEPIVGDDNKIYAVVCQSRDVTRIEKLRTEASRMMDASLDVFCTVNDKGKFLYVSPASLNHWGYTPEELIGKSMQDLILEEDLPKTKEIIKAILSGQEIKSYVNRYKKKDGGIAYNLWSARVDENTQIRYAVAKDCKEKIEQEEKILLSEQRFKALVQEGNDLYAIIDKEGNYIYMSPSSLAIIGIPPETFIGRDAFEFIHPDDTEQALKSLKKVASEDKVAMELYRAKNHENEWRWVETVLTNMLDHPAIKGIIISRSLRTQFSKPSVRRT
jgi:PAS domain S-box-containing protein